MTILKQAIHRLGVLLGEQPGALLTKLTGTEPIPAMPPSVPVGLRQSCFVGDPACVGPNINSRRCATKQQHKSD